MFEVQPDDVESEVGGVADVERQVMAHAADTRAPAAAEFLQRLACSHGLLSRVGVGFAESQPPNNVHSLS